MEDVLEVYTRPYDPRFPQICMDESAKHLLQDKREGLAMQKGRPERFDYTFEAAGMCKLFLACEPLTGQRQSRYRFMCKGKRGKSVRALWWLHRTVCANHLPLNPPSFMVDGLLMCAY
jgi:hypothetical protein